MRARSMLGTVLLAGVGSLGCGTGDIGGEEEQTGQRGICPGSVCIDGDDDDDDGSATEPASSGSGASEGQGGCGNLTYAGECDGDVLVWCEDDHVMSADCAETGKVCGYQDATVGNNCVPPAPQPGALLTVSQIVGVAYDVTQPYGPTTFDGGYSYCQSYGNWGGQLVHCGVDIGIPYGTTLRVPGDGTVLIAGGSGYFEDAENKAAGELLIELDGGVQVILGHMSQIWLGVGQSVAAGEEAGASGSMNGPHLHLELRVPDPTMPSGYRTEDPMTYFGP